jgi:hypothetical protein
VTGASTARMRSEATSRALASGSRARYSCRPPSRIAVGDGHAAAGGQGAVEGSIGKMGPGPSLQSAGGARLHRERSVASSQATVCATSARHAALSPVTAPIRSMCVASKTEGTSTSRGASGGASAAPILRS